MRRVLLVIPSPSSIMSLSPWEGYIWVTLDHIILSSMIIDGTTLITGWFKFMKAAERENVENPTIIRCKGL